MADSHHARRADPGQRFPAEHGRHRPDRGMAFGCHNRFAGARNPRADDCRLHGGDAVSEQCGDRARCRAHRRRFREEPRPQPRSFSHGRGDRRRVRLPHADRSPVQHAGGNYCHGMTWDVIPLVFWENMVDTISSWCHEMTIIVTYRIPHASQGAPMKLTQASIARLPSDKADAVYYDDDLDGFGIRIRAGGSRNYVVRYRLGGLERRHTIGSASVLTLEEARQKARKVLVALTKEGTRQQRRQPRRRSASLLFSSVAADYLEAKQSTMRPRSHDEMHPTPQQGLEANPRPSPWHREPHGRGWSPARDCQDSGNTAANRARATLSAMYAWAIGEGLCETNPVDRHEQGRRGEATGQGSN